MICRVGDARYHGRAVTVRKPVDPRRVARAVRSREAIGSDPTVAVATRGDPGPFHRHVGCVRPSIGLRVKTALARAGRSLGLSTPVDQRIRDLRDQLARFDDPGATSVDVGPTPDRREDDLAALREAVAAARGRVLALRETDAASEAAEAELESAVADLADAETAVAATRQQQAARRERAREARDRLERRFALEDDLANRRRDARAHLVEELAPEYAEALDALPGERHSDDPFEAPPHRAALAIARIGAVAAPIVLAEDPFESAREGAEWLDAPVLRVRS